MRLPTIGLLSAVLSGTVVLAQDQEGVFSAKVEAVRVDALVTNEEGQALHGLGPENFEIFDNGVRQQIDLVSFEQLPLNVIFVLDMSDSVAGERLLQLRRASETLLGGLRDGDQAALVTFSHRVALSVPLTSNFSDFRRAFEAAQGVGDTALIDGTFAGIMVGERDAGRALVIVFSDGVDTASWLPAAGVLDIARRSDSVVYGVSVHSEIKPEFLEELTRVTGGKLSYIEKSADLSDVFRGVLSEFRLRYLLSYSPRGVDSAGWHRLEVRLKGRKGQVRARPGYLAGS